MFPGCVQFWISRCWLAQKTHHTFPYYYFSHEKNFYSRCWVAMNEKKHCETQSCQHCKVWETEHWKSVQWQRKSYNVGRIEIIYHMYQIENWCQFFVEKKEEHWKDNLLLVVALIIWNLFLCSKIGVRWSFRC